MTEHNQMSVSDHYDSDRLGERILAALAEAGVDLDHLTPDDLAPLDQFHMGGRDTTLQLLQLAGISPGAKVLDAGGGIGGPARTLATQTGCHVTVVDLSQSFCDAGTLLTERTGLSDQVRFIHGDATAMPVPDGEFDVVWTQHSSMNIPDKAKLYAEFHRVLRPGGKLAIHEVMAGPNGPVHFPVPWARRPEISFVRPTAEIRSLITQTGFREIAWVDLTGEALEGWRKRLANPPAQIPTLGLHVLLGSDWPEMTRQLLRNLEEQRTEVVQAVFERI
jgi:SAM-dependent methyltransferase